MCYYYKDGNRWLRDMKPWEALRDINLEYESVLKIGFNHPKSLVITATTAEEMEWGLLPVWAKNKDLQKNTLNARVETLAEKPSFKGSLKNRCLIPATSFIEWQWLDPKGKKKQKYEIRMAGAGGFCFGGLYSNWLDRTTGELLLTFTIITREAEGVMREIHNSKLRMPLIVPQDYWDGWLAGEVELPPAPELTPEKEMPDNLTHFPAG
jgi:putative SOS response-associated peptidase YedK